MQSGLTPYNDATRDVIAELSGVRSPERVIMEFFGIAAGALAAQAKDVRWHPRLAELGVDERTYADITGQPVGGAGSNMPRRGKKRTSAERP